LFYLFYLRPSYDKSKINIKQEYGLARKGHGNAILVAYADFRLKQRIRHKDNAKHVEVVD